MVACTKCSSENSIDSLFCRRCGEAIAADERTLAQQKHEDLIAEGYKIFNEGRTGEAKLIAETCLTENSNSSSALSLKGMCHERAGELALALGAYERVVELNPDSALDKIKVTHLRQSLTGKTLVEPLPQRGRALLGAAAAVVLVVAVGVAIASNGPEPVQVAARSSEPLTAATNAFGELDAGQVQTPAEPKVEQKTPAGTTDAPQGQAPPVTAPRSYPSNRPTGIPPTTLPNVNGGSGIEGEIGGTSPVKINIPQELTLRPDASAARASNADAGPDPKIERPSQGNIEAEPKPQENSSVIEIKRSDPRPPSLGGSTPVNSENGVEALLKTASQQFLLGRYGQAANTYEAALRAGASGGSTNQRIAQSHANAGNKNAAIAAYRRAISAYEASLAGGENPRTKSALESCRQALKVLGG